MSKRYENDFLDEGFALDVPFQQLNKKGRKLKKHTLKIDKLY